MFFNRKEVAVVIPIYKSQMTPFEEISFDRCLKILGRYPLILMSPQGLDLTNYLQRAPGAEVRRFEPTHFSSVAAYDRLMLKKSFYDRFHDYRYILIYQLDAFVFSDQLESWCAKGFDYVGAPWLDEPDLDKLAAETGRMRRMFPAWAKRLNVSVGNGGLSLRKVRSFRSWLSILGGRAHGWPYHEDAFWGLYVASFYPLFRVPKFNQALKFSFELSPAKCFELNNRELPFGCHAWEKYDIDFWRPFFRDLHYSI
jgi:hypothetical protein